MDHFQASSSTEEHNTSAVTDPYEFYNKVGRPKYFVAPMVDQSELAYRMLTRKYGADICYTPMFHARLFSQDPKYRNNMFQPCAEDRPLVVQFCANDPDILLAAAKYVEDDCDAVDINLGCPQGIAKKGNYGSFLLENTDLIVSLVQKLKAHLKVPVTCKIRCLPSEADTLHLAQEIEKAGAALLTVHGRTRDHNKQTVGPANYSIIKKIKETLKIPVIVNGGISSFEDIGKALDFTKCDGVMSSESILEYPALFDNSQIYDLEEMALEYLDFYEKYPGEGTLKIARSHIHKFLHSGFTTWGHSDLRDQVQKSNTIAALREIVLEMQKRRQGVVPLDKITWYYRHWNDEAGLFKTGVQNKNQLPASQIMDSDWNTWMQDDPRNPQCQTAKDAKKLAQQMAKEQKRLEKLAAAEKLGQEEQKQQLE